MDIYTKVTFSEDMTHVKGDGAAARPELFHRIGSTDTQYDILNHGDTLASGDCKPNDASDTDVYVCRYTVGGSDSGAFKVKVGTNSADEASNGLATAYTHATALTLDTTAPAAPVDLSAAAGNAQVRLTWSDPSPADASIAKWQVRQKSSGNYGNWQDVSGGAAARSHTVTNLANGTAYTFQVRAMDTAANEGAAGTAGPVTPAVPVGPAVTGALAITSTAGTYTTGDVLEVTVTFDKSIVVTGTPRLTIKVGTADKTATCARKGSTGDDAKKLVCSYTVASGDEDSDGVSVEANKLSLPSGASIKDGSDVDATLTHNALAAQSGHKVDAKAPTISTLAISSSPPSNQNGHYKIGDAIKVTATFSEALVLTGAPTLKIKVGTVEKTASCALKGTTGDDAKKLVCSYAVAEGDADANGVAVEAGKLAGTIKDGANNAATLTYTAITDSSGHKVDGVKPTISTLAISSSPPAGQNGHYKIGDAVKVTATFSEAIELATRKPTLKIKVGTVEKTASCALKGTTGDDAKKLVCTYTVAVGDADTDGIAVEAGKLSGTIRDGARNAATRTYTAITDSSGHKIDGVRPTITGFEINDAIYKAGAVMSVRVVFSEAVDVTGTPTLAVKIGTPTRTASFTSGGQEAAKKPFNYTIQSGDNDADGVSIDAGSLMLPAGASIKDYAGNAAAAPVTYSALAAQSGVLVDTAAPGIAFPSTAPRVGAESTITLTDAIAKVKKYGAIAVDGSTGAATDCDAASEIGSALATLTTPATSANVRYTPPSDAAGKKVCVYAEDAAGNSGSSLWTTAIGAASTVTPPLAQTGIKLVSNTAQTKSVDDTAFGDVAQAFTTGSHARGYELTRVDLFFRHASTTAPVYAVSIHADSSGRPGSVQGMLRTPSSLPATTVELVPYTARGRGIHLAANTTYWVVVDVSSPGTGTVARPLTSVDAEDGGGATGWSIGDGRLHRAYNSNTWLSSPHSLKLGIHGTETRGDIFHGVRVWDFQVSGVSDEAVTLSWNGQNTTSAVRCGYLIESRRKGDSKWRSVKHFTYRSRLSVTIGYLQPGTVYDVRVSVLGPPGEPDLEAYSTTVKTTGEAPGMGQQGPTTEVLGPPALGSARVDGTALTLAFDADLDESSSPPGSAFSVKSSQAEHAVAAVAVSGREVTLTLSRAVAAGDAVTVDYMPPSGAGRLRAAGGGPDVVRFSGRAATNATPAPAPLTARFEAVPSEHRGRGKFTLRVAFSAPVAGSADAAAIQVTGGTLERVRRVSRRADLWALTVKPASRGAVTVTLPATTDCAAAGAVCTSDGRRLQSPLTVTVPGPAGTTSTAGGVTLSAAAMVVAEGSAAAYTAVLDTQPAGDVTLAPTSGDAGAVSVVPAALTFTRANWSTPQVVQVTGLQDDDRSHESVVLSHAVSGANYGSVTVAGLHVTVTDDDADPGVHAVAVTSRPARGDTYGAGETIQVTVTFTEPVTVRAIPRFTLAFGRATRNAPYVSGSGTTALVFEYVVTPTDRAPDGIGGDANALHLNGGAIQDAEGNDADLTHNTVVTGQKVDGSTAVAGVTVSTAAVTLGEGGATAYTVRLNTAPAGVVTVRPASDDEAAVTVSSALTFGPGNWNRAQNVTVRGEQDSDAAGAVATITHAVSGYDGVTAAGSITVIVMDDEAGAMRLQTASATAASTAPADDDGAVVQKRVQERLQRVNREVLPRTAQAMTASTRDAVTSRIDAAAAGGVAALRPAGHDSLYGMLVANADAIRAGTLGVEQVVHGSSFVLPLHAAGAPAAGPADGQPAAPSAGLTLWGGGDYRSLTGSNGGVAWDGGVLGAHVGIDTGLAADLLAGLALSWARGALDYEDRSGPAGAAGKGTHESWTLSLHPYVSWTPGGMGLWATAGYGLGVVTIDDEQAPRRQESGATLLTATVGGHGLLLTVDGVIAGGTTTLRLRGEGSAVRSAVDGGGEDGLIEEQAADVHRLRLILEGSHEQPLGGGMLTPKIEVGMRYDGGGAAVGTGVELGGGLRYALASLGLAIEGRGRMLLTVPSRDEHEWGVGGLLRLAPADGRGLSVSVLPSWGETASGTERLWQQGAAVAGSAAATGTGRLTAELGYGLAALGGAGLMTPYGGLTLSEADAPSYRVGGRFEMTQAVSLSVEGERRERAGAAEYGVELQGQVRY